MVKVLHTGDLHLDSAFVGLTGEQAQERRAQQRNLLRRIVELGNEQGVQILLLAGDLLDGDNAYYETVEAMGEILAQSKAQVFLAPGNHDAYHSASPYRSVRFSPNVHLFTGAMESIPLPELGVWVHGAGFSVPECETGLLRGFHAPQDGCTHLMVLHGEVTGSESRYNPIREEEIAESGLHYLALGHVHGFEGIKRAGRTDYAYCGCPEGRGFDELGEKGVLLGEVDETGARMELIPMAHYHYRQAEILLTPESDVRAELAGVLPEEEKTGYYRVILTGEADAIPVDALKKEFAPRVGSLELFDRTTPPRTLWEGEEEDNLKGIFLRNLHRRYQAAESEEERAMLQQAVRFGVAALDHREEPQ